MTAPVRNKRRQFTPAEDYECKACHGRAIADITVRVEHKPDCPVRKHLLRVRAAAKARAA